MTLFVFAHLKEADVFIDKLNFKKENLSLNHVYSNENDLLIITGEGTSNVISKLTHVLSIKKKSISRVLNFGIAGRLDPQLKLNKCYKINSVIMDGRIFELDEKEDGVSCITSHHSISNESDAKKLMQIGQIVDMELWSVVDVARAFNLPIQSVKLLSDDAGQTVSLNDVLKNVKFYSERLFDYFSKHF
jgi:nucleoside phosphorylase